jgi:polyisoprenyl-phosphate glycosyltransferase
VNDSSRPSDQPDLAKPLISLVIPALNEAANIPDLMGRFGEFEVDYASYDFELVLVDDGSTDETADLTLKLAATRDRVKVVRLARSFGAHYAISAGLAHCAGDCAVVFGADLQEPPSLLASFIADWENGSDVVWGVRRTRTGRSGPHEILSKSFSALFSRYAQLANYPPEGPSGVLVDRSVIDELVGLPERNRNVLALIAWLGFTQSRVEFDLQERRHGESRWTRGKMIKLAADSLIQFSSMPLRLFSVTGVIVAAIGILYAIFLVARDLVGVSTPTGWPTVIVIVLVLGGTQLTVAGVMGEYLWRGVEESRGRPLYVVRDVRTPGDFKAGPAKRRQARTQHPDGAVRQRAVEAARPENEPTATAVRKG